MLPSDALRPWVTSTPNDQGEQRGDCPLHGDGTNDASFNFDKGVWSCYAGCEGGSIDALLWRIWQDDIPEPEERKLRKAREREPLPSDAVIAGWAERLQGPDAKAVREWLWQNRNIRAETLKRFEVGFNGRDITIPIRDQDGSIVNVRRREPGSGKKVLGLTGHPAKLAWPLPEFTQEAADHPDAPLVICEGELDCLVLWDCGFIALTCTGGAHQLADVMGRHRDLFEGRTVLIATDNDESGDRARDALLDLLDPVANVVVLDHPAGVPEKFDISDLRRSWGLTFAERLESLIARDEAGTDEPGPNSWRPVGLSAYMTGDVAAEPPSILRREDGPCLLYERKLQSVVGESESAKTWLALAACLELVRAKRHVLFLDFEDDPSAIASRLAALGVAPETADAYFHYVRPDDPLTDPASNRAFLSVLDALPIELTVVDGITEVMALHGWGYDNIDYANFIRLLPRRLMAAGPAVLLLDHLPLSNKGRREAIGGQHKRAALTGTGLRIDSEKPFGRGMEGRFKITVTKDKGGGFVRALGRAGDGAVAEFHLFSDADTGRVTYSLEPPTRASTGSGERISISGAVTEEDAAAFYAGIVKYLRNHGPSTQNTLTKAKGLLTGTNSKRTTVLEVAAKDADCPVEVRGAGGNNDPLTYYLPEEAE